jgi:hypothetical protein
VAAYLFGVDRSQGLIASFCAAAFALALGFGYATGAGNRAVAETKIENLEFCRKLFLQPEVWEDDRAFCRVATIFGEECDWMIADSLSRISEGGSFPSQVAKFDHVFMKINSAMKNRVTQTPNCALP